MKLKFYSLLLLSLCVFACTSSDSKESQWIKTDDNTLLWLSNADTTITYKWIGKSFDGVANGKGQISYTDKKGNIIKHSVSTFFGASEDSEIVLLDDGGKYIGNIINNMMDGFGILIKGNELYKGIFSQSKPNGYLKLFKNNKIYYDGYWKDGVFNGRGTLYKEDGSIKSGIWENGALRQTLVDVDVSTGHYKGYAKDGKPDGLGKMEYTNGSSYQGQWTNGVWSGEGLYVSDVDSVYGIWENGKVYGDAVYRTNDFIFQGTLYNNSPLGIGLLTTRDGTFYTGTWYDGKRDGTGDMVFQNGDAYSGEWKDNFFDGYGEYRYAAAQAIYRGDWEYGLQNGNGIYECPDFSYDGQWEKGWMNGEGVFQFKNRDKYEGTVHENIIDGVGCYTYANGNRYEGEFVNGNISGLGVFQLKNGSRFEGEFLNGKIYGDGTMYLCEKEDTIAITGFWPFDGTFPKEGSILFSDGDLYEGPLNNGVPTEEGTWISGEERQAQLDKIENSTTHKVNEFYKKHRGAIDISLTGLSLFVSAVGAIGAPTGFLPACAEAVNIGINVVDASLAIASASIDVYENDQLGEDNSATTATLATEVGMNAAFILVPKAVKSVSKPLGKVLKNIQRSSAAALAQGGKYIAKKSAIRFIKGKVSGKVIRISITIQSGIRKVEKTLVRSKLTRNLTIATGRLFTSLSDQAIKYPAYLNKLKNDPALREKLKMSLEGSSKYLEDNMRLFPIDKWVKRNERIRRYLNLPKRQVEAHHIIPSNPQTELGRQARSIWTKYFDSVDHPCNGIWLGRSSSRNGYKALAKGSNHSTNSIEYETYVANAVVKAYKKYQKQYAKDPEMMQKVIAETVDHIKDKLYRGELAIGSGSHTVHTPWSIFTDSKGVVLAAANTITSLNN